MSFICSKTLGYLQVLEQVGKGAYSQIYKVYSKDLDSYFAAKIENSVKEETTDEYNNQKLTNHPLICQLYDTIFNGTQRISILEFIKGETLLDKVNKEGTFSEFAARLVLLQIISILNHLHNEIGIIHCDLKCENFIIDDNGVVHLIDFGFSKKISKFDFPQNNQINSGTNNSSDKSVCGSPNYMAPELIRNQQPSKESDIWSVGIILYAITTGNLPFQSTDKKELFNNILNKEPEFPKFISHELKDLIRKMILKDPSTRISINGIAEHPWFTINLNEMILRPNLNVFNQLSILPESEADIDKWVISILSQYYPENEIKEHVLKHVLSSNDTVLYQFFRRKELEGSIAALPSKIFTQVRVNQPSIRSSESYKYLFGQTESPLLTAKLESSFTKSSKRSHRNLPYFPASATITSPLVYSKRTITQNVKHPLLPKPRDLSLKRTPTY